MPNHFAAAANRVIISKGAAASPLAGDRRVPAPQGPCTATDAEEAGLARLLARMRQDGLSLRRDPASQTRVMLVREGMPSPSGARRATLGAGHVPARLVDVAQARGVIAVTGPGRWVLAPTDHPHPSAAAPVRHTDESPLAWLHARTGSDGRPLLSARAYLAGERFRHDVTAAAMLPQVTVNWSRLGALEGAALPRDPALASDHVIAARQRVRAAYRAIGPRMGDFVLDVCAFLQPLQEAERRRGWPARSGKLVLQLALERLADHYGVETEAQGPARSKPVAWQADGARAGMAAWLDAP